MYATKAQTSTHRDQFFGNCTDCKVDILATHYYGCDIRGLKWYKWHQYSLLLKAPRCNRYIDTCRKYGLPIWLTEFDCPNADGGADRQREYMLQVR